MKIVFGSGWEDAEFIIALWSLVSIFRILLVSINSAVYISKGKPKLSFYLQIIDLAILVPTCIIGVKYGLHTFVIVRCVARLDIIFPSLYIISRIFNISIKEIIRNLTKPVLITIAMSFVGLVTKNIIHGIVWQFVSILICVCTYGVLCLIFAQDDFKNIIRIIKKK